MGYRYAADQFETFGSLCGVVPPFNPEACASETLDETAKTQWAILALPVTVLSTDRVRIGLVPEYRFLWLDSHRQGLRSGAVQVSEAVMSGFAVGVEVQTKPLGSWPGGVFAALHAGALNHREHKVLIGGYAPFKEDISFVELELGVLFRR